MPSTGTIPENSFYKMLREDFGVTKLKTWRNNNSTLFQEACVVDVNNSTTDPAKIISELFKYKIENKDTTTTAVPTAGWKAKKQFGHENRLITEYAQSFSLTPLSAKDASVIIRASEESQKMQIFQEGDQHYFRFSPGVRITDADKFLLEKGFALPPNMPTLHTASLIGAAANGCYGPNRDGGPMTENIVEMKIITPSGLHLTLSNKEHENPELFEVLRDGHLGACYVSEMVMKIEPKFLMKRTDKLFKDVQALNQHMSKDNLIDKEHFIAMYIPVDIEKKDHAPQIRITNFERTKEQPTTTLKTYQQKSFCDFLNLELTEISEPFIDLVTKSPRLRKFFPFIIDSAAWKTYGTEKETTHVDWSASTAHIFGTYTDLPIRDINWLIQVDSLKDARDLLLKLLELTEKILKEEAKNGNHPLLNAFARHLKGICYPEGKGGIAHCSIDKEHQSILSFEFVTYEPLANTPAFKRLVNGVVDLLKSAGKKFHYHPGKHMPENIRSLTQIFTDAIDQQKLKNFQDAVVKLHGGVKNVKYSPLLTRVKKEFIGLTNLPEEEYEVTNIVLNKEIDKSKSISPIPKASDQKALEAIRKLAEENLNHDVVKKVEKYLNKECRYIDKNLEDLKENIFI